MNQQIILMDGITKLNEFKMSRRDRKWQVTLAWIQKLLFPLLYFLYLFLKFLSFFLTVILTYLALALLVGTTKFYTTSNSQEKTIRYCMLCNTMAFGMHRPRTPSLTWHSNCKNLFANLKLSIPQKMCFLPIAHTNYTYQARPRRTRAPLLTYITSVRSHKY